MTKIILVEDDDTMRSLLVTLLDLEGFETHPFGNMKEDELLNNISSIQPAAMLLDVHLRNLNGLDVLQKIRQNPDLQSLPIAMISGEDLAAECLTAGADKFILKPFNTDDLIAWLNQAGQ
jgi:two-component system, OmpR family, alkaline phosphatase synthesis response regulator PhoP